MGKLPGSACDMHWICDNRKQWSWCTLHLRSRRLGFVRVYEISFIGHDVVLHREDKVATTRLHTLDRRGNCATGSPVTLPSVVDGTLVPPIAPRLVINVPPTGMQLRLAAAAAGWLGLQAPTATSAAASIMDRMNLTRLIAISVPLHSCPQNSSRGVNSTDQLRH